MFDKEYSFRGIHAKRVNQLTAKFNDSSKLFDRNFDVYLVAPIIGFLYGRKSGLDVSTDETTKIFPDMLIRNNEDLMFNYRLIMLLDKAYEPDLDKRIDKAFRLFGKAESKPDEEIYESYVRGGVDVLYEKLIQNANNPDDYLANLYDFLEEFDERYNVNADGIADLCRLARS